MSAKRSRTLLECSAATALAAIAWVATWRGLSVGGFPPLLPAAGLSLAWLLARGGWRWVPVCIGGLAGALAGAPTVPQALALGVSVVAPTLITWLLLSRVARVRPDLGDLRTVVALPIAALLGSMAGAALALPFAAGTGLLVTGGALQFWAIAWMSNLLGVLVFTPPALLLAYGPRSEHTRKRRAEMDWICAAVLALSAAIFLAPGPIGVRLQAFALGIMPLMAWVTLRGVPGRATSLPAAAVLIAVIGAAHDLGLYRHIDSLTATRTIQSVGGVLAFSTLLLAANEGARRRAMDAAQEREARLRRVLENSNDGFWEWEAATDCVEASERLSRMLGYEPGQFVRTSKQYWELMHPADQSVARAAVDGNLDGRTPFYAVEYRMRHREGHWVWLFDRGRVTERDAAGKPLKASGAFTDISERKWVEVALRASREMFENFMRHSPTVAFVRDLEGRLHWTNHAFQMFAWGHATDDYAGRKLEDFLPAEVARHLRESDAETMTSTQPIVVEQHVVRPAGEAWWLTVKFPIRRADGQPLIGCMAVDITERRRVEEHRRVLESRVMESQKLEGLGLLAGGIAHDFNNILTGILGYADLARLEAGENTALRASLEHIVGGARSAADLTRQMLTYAGRGAVATHALVLSELVAEMGHLVQVSLPKRVTLEYEFAPELPQIDGDDAQLRQVVMNLIVNAAEAMGERSGSLVVRVHARECDEVALYSRWATEEGSPGTYVVLEVIDNGCGMPDETLARIFDPFFSTKFIGRGLGLAAVLGIVRGHRGVIQVESMIGAGTTFRVLLPALRTPAPAHPPVAEDRHWLASGTALVIDDEPTVREVAHAMLGRLGFDRVLTAEGGREGVQRFREHASEIRLVLLDVTMPDLNGYAVLREILAIQPEACVVMSSGYGELPQGDGSTPAAAAFIDKPYRLEDMARTLRALLGQPPEGGARLRTDAAPVGAAPAGS